jgi:ferrochelatase
MAAMAVRYDAILLVSFGGPEAPDDVMPFLQNVVRGRNVPPERLREVAKSYERLGGRSPLPEQCRELQRAIAAELARHGQALPVYWGNRNWHPFLADTLRRMRDDGVARALAFVTSAYASYSGCRQYLEDIARARAEVGDRAPVVDKLRGFHNHPGFVEPLADRVRAALEQVLEPRRSEARLVFTAHSLPLSLARAARYEAELLDTAALVAERAGRAEYALVYQSRSGPPSQPWLEPDVGDHLRALAQEGVRDVVLAPIGFLSDHVEVAFDLDVAARARAEELGIRLVRAATVGTDPRFVAMIRELVRERTEGLPRRALGARGPAPDVCPEGCCLPARQGP